MTPVILRQLWSAIEAIQANVLLSLDDASLVRLAIERVAQERPLNGDETNRLQEYLSAKTSLIRDLAQQRGAGATT